MTQRSASSKLDFPQPFGPTTPVKPSEMIKSVGSTKLLKPVSFSLEKRNCCPCYDSVWWHNLTAKVGLCQFLGPRNFD